MSAVILASTSKDLAARVGQATGDHLLVLEPKQLPAGPAQVMALANGSGPVTAVLIDSTPDTVEDALGLATRFEQQYPAVSVMLVTDRVRELGLSALRSGVRDLLEPSATVEDLRWALHRGAAAGALRSGAVAPEDTGPAGRVITVASPKGGVGKTTMATNLAVGLAGESPDGTVLVDLDVQFGDVAAALNLEPDDTLGDAVHSPAVHDAMALKTFLTRHPSGLHVLCGVRSPVEADGITAAQVGGILAQLKTEFRYVVIDTAPGMSAQTLAALDHTTDLALITSLDVPGVRGLRKELELLDELELPASTRHVIINFADRSGGLSVKDVEATIGRPVDFVLPRSKKFTISTNQGVPLIEAGGRDRISKDLRAVVARFAPLSSAQGGWNGRHRGSSR